MRDRVEDFIKRWTARSGGAERANYALFLVDLCELIGVARPNPAGPETELNDYVFERAVRFRHDDGSTSSGRIDLYKKGCFVLEAKQSKKREEGGEVYKQLTFALGGGGGTTLLERPRAKTKAKSAPLSTWDALMRSARKQAENYARALDEWPPFLIVVDVGHVIELYADFSRQGKNYAQFPDRKGFRIAMADLRSTDVRERLKRVWEDPLSLDPARHAAEVTQEIAALLAKMTQTMERRAPSQEPALRAEWAYKVSKFLMRCIFAMFAEDIGLLPKGAFLKLIQQHKAKANRFHLGATDFFKTMDKGGYSPAIQEDIRKFNGGLFHETISVEITEDELNLLEIAAGRDWRAVEPAIFGTLLEQALSERERSQLGAHFTPRAYVERLVVPTIIEPLREDWENVQSEAIGKLLDRDEKGALAAVKKFHDTLCDTRVLDPACGTGNFLYVSMELMKRLEGEVLDMMRELGETTEPLRTVDPHQFLGLEFNPRAVPITELVLWIGYIQWWFRTQERKVIAEPILRDFGTVKVADAVLAYDRQELLRDEQGRPITRQDPHALKLHPITGEPVPDPDAKLEVYRYVNPRPAEWPEAEFVVGNPPFIGKGEDMRTELGDGYVKALWASRGKKSDSIDYVMYWWDHAATLLRRKNTKLRRFGFITTNSFRQSFNQRMIHRHINATGDLSIAFAVSDHPWIKQPKRQHGHKAGKKAAVRIAMTVVERGRHAGRLGRVILEEGLDSDTPRVEVDFSEGQVLPNLRIGTDTTGLAKLESNCAVSSLGVALHGMGFLLTPQEAATLGYRQHSRKNTLIKPYLDGRDLTDRPQGNLVIDAYPRDEDQLRRDFPAIYQWLLDRVLPERAVNRDKQRKERWWWFGRTHADMRTQLNGLSRFIGTTETSKHRFFQFIERGILPDHMVIAFALEDAFYLGVLSSRIHVLWALETGGTLENRPRYNKTKCFETFAFPHASEAQRNPVRAFAQELDILRKRVLAEHDFLTMTKLYNVRAKLKSGEPLDESEKAIHDAGCVGVIHELHNKIDAAVAEAYGWPADLSGDDILARLVALNKERADEEKRGIIRWLRPEYQAARAKVTVKKEQLEAVLEAPEAELPSLPKDDAELVAALRRTLRVIGKPVEPKALAQQFRDGGKAVRRVERGLRLLVAAGAVRRSDSGWFLPSDRAA
ncbi:MAG TPA: DNA methyltransferase [Bradyrhizobium sp.]|nr:DNA methyltransferase [Bradyrhizobium sp.]